MADDELMDHIAENEEGRRAGRDVSLEDFLNKLEIEDKKEGMRSGRDV